MISTRACIRAARPGRDKRPAPDAMLSFSGTTAGYTAARGPSTCNRVDLPRLDRRVPRGDLFATFTQGVRRRSGRYDDADCGSTQCVGFRDTYPFVVLLLVREAVR
ncbi:hypothetical protein B0H17DRAFT_1214194 [Mycena rosella]|uniref:Uncharacterized protein n=1 Tax=Mycena rosella TaxID=1033263 RepID=A0AAD7G4P3_MYCRO|nr:hypothetical protein B0H17DRAFT_1214194 [Mycena rosella]